MSNQLIVSQGHQRDITWTQIE